MSDTKPNRYDTGLGTTPGMWQLLSDILSDDETKLPQSLNAAIYALCNAEAVIVAAYPMEISTMQGAGYQLGIDHERR